ncbi:zinc transporter 7%2C partial [Xyrichtys novacula]|uniref:Zinc transporter n=1 Tax=Xyrichtys novacula TaxID=13765 RepID=A0AAV1FEP2_XYRNO|nr:zinc transporter 7%2C partial [Xyrichtys novacula]
MGETSVCARLVRSDSEHDADEDSDADVGFQLCQSRGSGRLRQRALPHLHSLLHLLRRSRGKAQKHTHTHTHTLINKNVFLCVRQRALEPPDVHHERLLPVSVAGLLVNLVGIFVFQHGGHGHSHGEGGHGHSHSLFNGSLNHGHSHGGHDQKHADRHGHGHGGHGHSHDGHGHSHGGHGHSHGGHDDHCHDDQLLTPGKGSSKQILQGVLLHIIADTLGSVGVIISALLMQKYDLMIADPICSMLIALLIGVSVVPLLRESIGILMQRTPPSLDHALPECYQRVQQLQGVYNLQEPHFWTLCTDVYIGTLKLLVAPDADTRWILSQTHHIFTQAGVRQLYVQIDTAAM